MSDFVVAIPSYDRAKELKKKTLKMLEENKINKSIITVFVANAEQKKIYETEIGTDYKIVIGVKGMVNIRNFITNYYPSKKKILSCDDDITRIVEGNSEGKSVKTVTNLKTLAEKGFKLCNDNNFHLWGLHPSNNPRSLKSSNKITEDLKYIPGGLYGVINDKSLLSTINYAEDFEKSIKYYIKYGGVIRFNNYSAFTTLYTPGGNESAGRTLTTEDRDKKKLANKYPKYAETYTRPNGRTEIRLLSQ